jgi:transcriptional regulator with XRE-family HTH domain
MTVLERIKQLCREKKNISITTLEQRLGFSNGSLSKAKDIPSSRIVQIADYLEVSVDYLMTGEEKENKMPIFEYSSDIMELIKLYSQLNKEQKSAILNMMRSFALTNQ